MNAVRSSGVSGGGTLPDQNAPGSPSAEGETRAQFCPHNDTSCQFRVRMKKSRARRWLQLPQAKRSQALAVLMGALDEGIDLHRLLDAEMQMRKAGVLLNQALHLTHGGKAALDTALVADAVRIIKGLRP